MDELTTRRERHHEQERAWFMDQWDQLDDTQRDAIAALVRDLHDAGLRRRPAAVAWLGERSPLSRRSHRLIETEPDGTGRAPPDSPA